MTEEQFKEIISWQDQQFPGATALSKISHLKEEVNELETSVRNNDPGVKSEIADCLFLIYGSAAKLGMSYTDICEAVNTKFKVNKERSWGPPDKNGVVKHVENTEV